MSENKREFPKKNAELVKRICDDFNLHDVIAQILISRGFVAHKDIHQFLYAKLPNLHSPFLLSNMDEAVDKIEKVRASAGTVLVYGDNDVDGISATTLLARFFKEIGIDFCYCVNSVDNSTEQVIAFAKKNHCSLVITVDFGTTAVADVKAFQDNAIDVIVTDHHELIGELPPCLVINPKLPSSTYPNKELTGVGVVFKLIHAISSRWSLDIDLKEYLDLVALGTIADLGQLQGENRVFVKYGLDVISRSKHKGLIALCEIANSRFSPIDLAAKVAPRLNSLGRIDNPTKAVDLLLASDKQVIQTLVQYIEEINIKRQQLVKSALKAIAPVAVADSFIVVVSKKLHPGIISIISAKLMRLHNKPVIVIAIKDGIGKGSIRTIPQFPLINVLKDLDSLLLSYGGHQFAAGIMVKEENIPRLSIALKEAAKNKLDDKDFTADLKIDATVSLSDLTFEFMENLRLLEPYGQGNMSPLLYTTATIQRNPKVIGDKHVKVSLVQGNYNVEAIALKSTNISALYKQGNKKLGIIFTPYLQKEAYIRLNIRDFVVL